MNSSGTHAAAAPSESAGPVEKFKKPYKGLESYQVEDGDLFYGRRAEAEQLIARILSSRITVLDAQSGAGKTSLLNASIIPGLESRGWFPVRILLQNDPIRATKLATLQYLLPPPEAEVLAIRRACMALEMDEHQVTIAHILKRYDEIPPRDQRKRELIAPIESEQLRAAHPQTGAGRITPYACRVLRGSLDIKTASEQWNVVLALAPGGAQRSGVISEDTPISELIESLELAEFKAHYRSLVAYLDPPGKCRLDDFFTNLVSVYGVRFSRFGLVLLFDQFEEIFTRFVESGPLSSKRSVELPDWHLRRQFFQELQRLYTCNTYSGGEGTGGSHLPIRIVLSLRSEFVTRLDPVQAFIPEIDQFRVHLQLLSVDTASNAIKQPADQFGYGYAQDCYDKIIADLTKEEQFVEPGHLQMVCEHLWNAKGRELAGQIESSPFAGEERPLVALEIYEEGKGLRGIMRAFLWGYLEGLEARDLMETVEILEQLITPSGTRNIVERDYLVSAPFLNMERRERLLDQLINRTIVRAETRLGGHFIEITHEFLIEPIHEAIRHITDANPDHKRFGLALEALGRVLEMARIEGTAPTLMDWEFDVLHKHREQVEWEDWSAETMFRNSICLEAEPAVIHIWAGMLKERRNEEQRESPHTAR